MPSSKPAARHAADGPSAGLIGCAHRPSPASSTNPYPKAGKIEDQIPMSSRRSFIGTVASGLATTLAAPTTVLGANDRVRLGIIGAGDRGMQLVREAISLPGVDFVAFADIYSRRLEDAKKVVPTAATRYDHRRLLEDKSIDAVLIATPQHLHCE